MEETLKNRADNLKSQESLCSKHSKDPDALIINEVQLLLAEKRTSMAAMRTGIAVFALPLSVLGLLIATSKYYDLMSVLPLIIPLGILLLALIILGSYLILRALKHIHHQDYLMRQLKVCHSKLSDFL